MIRMSLHLIFVLAHAGHGTIPADDPMHYLLEPVHFLGGILLLSVVGMGVLLFRGQSRRKALGSTIAKKFSFRSLK